MSEFHFLRPWWLAAILPCAVLIWQLRIAHDPARRWRQIIAPELLPHLLLLHSPQQGISPTTLLAFGWFIAVFALAGPTWSREPAPFGDDTAVLAIVLKVTPSMEAEDVQPTRLARAVQKIDDLLALRPGAKTALIAYSGSAHQVLPLTTDVALITSFAGELSPDVMPQEGDDASAALRLAEELVAQSGTPGWILWITDTVSADQVSQRQTQTDSPAVPVSLLAMSGEGPERQFLLKAATALHLPVVSVTPDETDVNELAKNTRFSAGSEGSGERWRDSGYWLVPILCMVCAGWFRRGRVIGGAP